MSIDYNLIQLIKTLYEMVGGVVQKHESETVLIRYSRDIRPHLESRLKKKGITEPRDQELHRMVYHYLKNTPALEKQPVKRDMREFKTTKTKWNEFYRSLFYKGKINDYKICLSLRQLEKENKLYRCKN